MATFAGIAVATIAFLVIALFAAFPAAIDVEKTEVVPYQVNKIALAKSRSVTGTIKPIAETPVKANSSGIISELTPLQSVVKKGDKLAVITSTSQEAVAQIDTKNKQIKRWQQEIKKIPSAKTTLAKFKKKYSKKLKALVAKRKAGSMSKKDFDADKYIRYYRKLVRNSKNPKAAQAKYQRKIDTLQQDVTTLSKQINQKVDVISPVNGILREWKFTESTNVSQNEVVCSLDDISTMKCDLPVAATDALDWKPGNNISLGFDNLGNVAALIQDVERDETGRPIKIWLHLEINNTKHTLKPNMEGTYIYTKPYDVLAIPEEAVMEKDSKHYVFVIRDDKVFKREIEVGRKSNKHFPISGKLSEGEQIVVSDKVNQLKDGQGVVIKSAYKKQ